MPPKEIRIGNQIILDYGDSLSYKIDKVLLHKGFKFTFGLRDKLINYAVSKAQRLQVSFKEFPDIKFKLNPIEWISLGERRKQNGYYKNDPMYFYFYYVNRFGNLVKKKQVDHVEQTTLLTNPL